MKRANFVASLLLLFTFLSFQPSLADEKVGFYAGFDVGTTKSNMKAKDFLKLLIDHDVFQDHETLATNLLVLFPGGLPTSDPLVTVFVPETLSDFEAISAQEIQELTLWGLVKKPDTSGYVFRGHVGYNLRSFIAIELAAFVTSDVTIAFITDDVKSSFGDAEKTAFSARLSERLIALGLLGVGDSVSYCLDADEPCLKLDAEAYTRGLELMAKLNLPLGPFTAYAKGGLAYTVLEGEANLRLTIPVASGLLVGPDPVAVDIKAKAKNDIHTVRGVYAVGLAYQASESLVVNLAYQRYSKSGDQPELTMMMLSLTAKFAGFDFCGDTLC